MSGKLPYVSTINSLSKTLIKIKEAATPARFTGDFLATKLGMSGGSARPVVPFLKRIGFLASDGSPTDLYRQFRNDSQAGAAAAEALRIGFSQLFEMNEYAHDLPDKDLKGLVVQATGFEQDSSAVRQIIGSFKALRAHADFDAAPPEATSDNHGDTELPVRNTAAEHRIDGGRLGLSYTINLNLPPTSDIAVFDAIFKSLREHLLRKS